MKTFWTLIIVLMASTGVLLAKRGDNPPNTPNTPNTATRTPAHDASNAPERPDLQPQPRSAPQNAEEPENTEPSTLPENITITPDSEPAPATDADDTTIVDVGIPDEPFDPTTLFGDPTPFANDDAVASAAADHDDDDTDTSPEATNTKTLNERYPLTGDGTAESPYVISFDMLIAVEHDYAPKIEGKAEIPEWIKVLDGKHVSITGFVAFPFLSATADECMVMLNQWDGCCIGVPPTPYDAVEVQFTQPLDLNRGVPNYGTLTGIFRTDPYLVNGWLIGLYVMDNATLINSGSKNQSGF
ncbi:MAG: hypothetical protein Q9O74_05310 [Planctomycetota bacterium]|nr:hypothetical protein [Planctomycetota bacterium]